MKMCRLIFIAEEYYLLADDTPERHHLYYPAPGLVMKHFVCFTNPLIVLVYLLSSFCGLTHIRKKL